jgi:hypothetical protein
MGFVEIGDQITRVEKILQLGSFTGDEIAALESISGAIVFNSTTGKINLAAGGAWVVIDE